MFVFTHFTKAASAIAMVSGLSLLVGLAPAIADGHEVGAKEYSISCQSCHGAKGLGDGEMAMHLNVRPSNLTLISKENDGVFPLLEVFQIIDGRQEVRGHGAEAMPVWGARYSEDIGDTYGPYGGEQVIRARVLELVFYLQSIQKM